MRMGVHFHANMHLGYKTLNEYENSQINVCNYTNLEQTWFGYDMYWIRRVRSD